MQCVENSAHFSSGHNDGYTHWSLGTYNLVHPWKIDVQNFLVKEQQGGECLILSRRRNPPVGSEVCQIGLEFDRAQIPRVLLVVKKNKFTNPLLVGGLGSIAILMKAHSPGNLFHKPGSHSR